MPLSILLTSPWDSKAEDTPPRLEVRKVGAHRLSWKNAGAAGIPKNPWAVVAQPPGSDDSAALTDDAEVITASTDEGLFRNLHGTLAKDANYDVLAEFVAGSEYADILDVIKAMARQHPDAMWFVRSWIIEAAASD